MSRYVYLDYNATAPLRPAARDAITEALAEGGNPSSIHGPGRAARRRVEEARETVAALAGVPPDAVVFTSGGTEANVLALSGSGRRVVASAVEHDSVLAGAGATVPCTAEGTVDLAALERLLTADPAPALVSIMAVNNETGVIQPVAAAADLAHRHGAWLHCDAVQAAGRIPLAPLAAGADLVSLSAHKLGGPAGVGALILGDGVALAPLLRGGGQERRRRAGTENVAGIAGFGAAAAAAGRELAAAAALAALRDRLEAELRAACPAVRVFGAAATRVANTSCLSMPGVPAETQVMGFDLAGIAVSAGAACSSGKVGASHVLAAMGVPDAEARTAIRVSLGWDSRSEHVDRFVEAWRRLHRRASPGGRAAEAA